MDWARILAYVTGTVDQELLARNEYLAAENRILKAQLKGRPELSDAERGVLGEIGHRLGRKILADVATVARPDTILGWYRKLVARKFDGSARRGPGRPRISREVEQLILRMASENRSWGYDRIAGALANLGHEVCDQTVGNVLRRHGLMSLPMTCVGCGFEILADFAFCPRCGRRQPVACASCGFVCEADFAFCPRCGSSRAPAAAAEPKSAA